MMGLVSTTIATAHEAEAPKVSHAAEVSVPFMIGLKDLGQMPIAPVSEDINQKDLGPTGMSDPDPSAILVTASVDVDALPVIRRNPTLTGGNEALYQIAIRRAEVPSTVEQQDINEYFVDPPRTDGLTISLRDVILFTLKNSPDIQIAQFRTEDAKEAIRAARAPLRPQVELGAAVGAEGVQSENVNRVSLLQRSEATVRVTQTLLDFGRGGQTIKRAEALHQSQLLQRQDAVEEAVFSAVTAYLNLLGAEQLVQSSRDNVSAHERIVALVEKNFKAGNLSEAETKRAGTRLDRARTSAIDLENRRERAMSEFRRATGLDPTTLAEPDLNIEPAYALTQTSVDIYLQDHPALQAALRDVNSLEHQIKAASRANLPEVSMQVVGAMRENVLGNEAWTTDARAMVAASWTAYDGGAANARKRQLLARKREAEANLERTRNGLKQDAYNIISVLTTSREKRSIYEEQVVSSERVVELYAKQFDAGRRTLLELLDAQADLALSREESIATKYENLAAAFASLRLQNQLTQSLSRQLNLPPAE